MNKELLVYEPSGKTENVRIRMTKAEKDSLVEKAKANGISISAFIRMLLANYNGINFKGQE